VHNRDWSLVFFTTLSQASVGTVVCLAFAGLAGGEINPYFEKDLGLANPVLLALILTAVATIISFLHLGNPANASNAMNNLAGSWVSREILALSVYSACLFVVLLPGWLGWFQEYTVYLLWLGAFAGLVFLWMMIRIYMMPTIPAWNSWYTPVSFVSTALCLGLVALLLFSNAELLVLSDKAWEICSVSLTVLLLLELLSGFVHQSKLEKMDTGIDEIEFSRGAFHRVYIFRMTLLVIALLALLIVTFFAGPVWVNDSLVPVITLMILLFAQEFTGRLLFYASYFRLGV
jgi:DMSO reductase anchor subunit